jgi:hypothetical protein
MTTHQGRPVFGTSDSVSVVYPLSSLKSSGLLESSLLGPMTENVFLNMAGERNESNRSLTEVSGVDLISINAEVRNLMTSSSAQAENCRSFANCWPYLSSVYWSSEDDSGCMSWSFLYHSLSHQPSLPSSVVRNRQSLPPV